MHFFSRHCINIHEKSNKIIDIKMERVGRRFRVVQKKDGVLSNIGPHYEHVNCSIWRGKLLEAYKIIWRQGMKINIKKKQLPAPAAAPAAQHLSPPLPPPFHSSRRVSHFYFPYLFPLFIFRIFHLCFFFEESAHTKTIGASPSHELRPFNCIRRRRKKESCFVNLRYFVLLQVFKRTTTKNRNWNVPTNNGREGGTG